MGSAYGLGGFSMSHTPYAFVGESRVVTQFWDASEAADRRAWIELWKGWPGREVQAHPDYVRLFARPQDRVLAAALETPKGGLLYPIIVRPLDSEPWGAGATGMFDVTNAYGYGGVYAWNADSDEAEGFRADVDGWMNRLGCVTTFARLSLFDDEVLPYPGTVIDRGPNIVRSLEVTPEELWASYEAKVRKNVQKARREGLEVRFDERGAQLDDFLAVYTSTMDRRHALEQYYFPKHFFETLLDRLPGQVLMGHALLGGKVVSTEMMLLSARTAYSFLGGTLSEAFAARPNDFLKHEMFLKCRERGLKRVVLGGSYTEGDGLLRYKKAFAPQAEGEKRFKVGISVHDEAAAVGLVERRRVWELAHGQDWSPAPGYFPAYRS
jgi:hypothetical protein